MGNGINCSMTSATALASTIAFLCVSVIMVALYVGDGWRCALGGHHHRQQAQQKWGNVIEDDLQALERRSGVTPAMIEDAVRLANQENAVGYHVLLFQGRLYAAPLGPLRKKHGSSFGNWSTTVANWTDVDHGQADQAMLTLMVIYQAVCLTSVPLQDVEFVLNPRDGGKNQLGVMSWSRRNGEQHDLLLPFLSLLDVDKFAANFFKQLPWEERQPVAVWRGSTTGAYFTAENWYLQARSKVVLECKKKVTICDAGFSNLKAQASPDGVAAMTALLGEKPFIPLQDVSRYKFVIVVDGNTAATRMGPLMFSNTTIIKQMSPEVEFYYAGLQPYVHYIPFSNTVGDLLSVIEWARTHDSAARQIAENAYAWAKTHLTTLGVADYVATLLNGYASRLMDMEPELTPHFEPWRVEPVGNFLPIWERSPNTGRCHKVRAVPITPTAPTAPGRRTAMATGDATDGTFWGDMWADK